MITPYEQAKLLGSELRVGEESEGLLCPFCNGGRSGDKSFYIKRVAEKTFLFVCFRANCEKNGGGRLGPPVLGTTSGITQPKAKEAKIYDGPFAPLPDQIRKFYHDTYGIDGRELEEANVSWNPDVSYTIWPVCSRLGELRGYELRRGPTGHGRKTLHYRANRDEAWIGWQPAVAGVDYDRLVVVEDLVSALKVSRHFLTCSLMGSHISHEHALELGKLNLPIALCLDRDASLSSIRFSSKYQFLCEIHPVRLERDLKYSTDSEICDIIGNAI